jgi:hypothetical protein
MTTQASAGVAREVRVAAGVSLALEGSDEDRRCAQGSSSNVTSARGLAASSSTRLVEVVIGDG